MSAQKEQGEKQFEEKSYEQIKTISALSKLFEEKVLKANLNDQEKREVWKELVKRKDDYVIGRATSILSKQYGKAVQYLFEEADYSDMTVVFDPKDTSYQEDMTRLYRQTHTIDEKDEINKGDAALNCFDRAIVRFRGTSFGNDIEHFKD